MIAVPLPIFLGIQGHTRWVAVSLPIFLGIQGHTRWIAVPLPIFLGIQGHTRCNIGCHISTIIFFLPFK